MNGTLRANGLGGSRTDKQPLTVGALAAPKNGPRFAADDAAAGHMVAHALHGHHNRHGADTDTLVASEIAVPLTRGSAASPGVSAPGRRKEDDFNLVTTGTLRQHPRPGSNSDGAMVPFSITPIDGQGSELAAVETDIATGIDRGMSKSSDRGMRLVEPEVGVRRLTPTECERLMSWPDGWTSPEGVDASDSRRYAACGDGVVSNVAEWIGRRIVAVDEMNGRTG